MTKQKQENTKNIYLSDKLIKELDAIFNYPLTIVEAPMGYGKTTAVRERFNQVDANVLWLRIHDSSKTAFWKRFCDLFGMIDQSGAMSLSQLEFPDDGAMVHEALNIIKGIPFSEETLMVMDDYQLVSDAETDSFLEAFIKSEIPHLRIVLISRHQVFRNLDELKLKGYLHHITKEALEFTPLEITKYFRQCGINLTGSTADELYGYTEGWISALYLLMMNYKEEGRFVAPSNIYKLVECAVYEPFSAEIKDFLLMLSILDSFTMEQAMYMWGNDAKQMLAQITSKNAFVNYDAATGTYQMHNIFTNYLEQITKEQPVKAFYYTRAAQWCMKNGEYLNAMRYCYLGEDYESLLHAMEMDKTQSFNGENKGLLLTYMEKCPDHIKNKNHVAMLIYAMHLFRFNEMERFGKTMGQFRQNLDADQNLNEGQKRELLGEFELITSFTTYNDINKMSEHHQRACELLSKTTSIYDTRNRWTFGSPSVLYMFYRESGKLQQQVKDIHKAMPYYYRLTDGHGRGAEYLMEAEWYFNLGDLENAEILLHKAFYKANSEIKTDINLCVEFLQIRIALMKGDGAVVAELLTKMRKEMTDRSDYFYLHTIEICEGYIYSLLKQPHKIPERVAAGAINSSRLLFPAYAMQNIVYGRSLLMNGQYLKLIGSMEEFLRIASVFPNLLAIIYTLIYTAAASAKINRQEEALAYLREALDRALPDELYMPFVENCDYIKPLLQKLKVESLYGRGVVHILGLHAVYASSVDRILKDWDGPRAKPQLTERELEISRLAAEGLNNKEIGARLFISENTVKTQLKVIFKKLGINSRALLK